MNTKELSRMQNINTTALNRRKSGNDHLIASINRSYWQLTILVILFTCLLPAVSNGQQSSAYRVTYTSLKEKDYFRARSLYNEYNKQLHSAEKLIITAYLDNAFNKPGSSNTAITLFFKRYENAYNDSLKLELLRLKQINFARLFRYADALKVTDQILSKYVSLLTDEERTDYSNTAMIWKALAGCPKQRISVRENTVMRMNRDKAGLANLSVRTERDSSNFIFDTGANFSTVTETMAGKFNMLLLKGTIQVGSITGTKVNSQLAICPSFTLGDITVANAVFLVMPDSALAFPQIKYQINGIIGFPVIEGLKEVQITRNDDFIVPKKRSSVTLQNMALEFLTPVISIGDEFFTFDTGATETMLYSKYFEKHEADIAGHYKLDELSFGGAGGMHKRKGYKIIYRPLIAGRQLEFKSVQLFAEKFKEEKDHYYGNIGQDIIKQFFKMTLNFSSMFIRFE